jgi:hypothetical protein
MKKPPVGAGTFCPLPILIFYILLCWKYLPVSGAGPSPWCYRKIPDEPQIKNVRKNCRRFTAWGGKVQDLDIFSKVRNNSGGLVYALLIIFYSLLIIFYSLLITAYSLLIIVYSLLISVYSLLISFIPY